MKKTFAFVLCLVFLFSLSGCNSKGTKEKAESVITNEETRSPMQYRPVIAEEPQEAQEPLQRDPAVEREILSLTQFSENRAWVNYEEDGASYYAMVDTNGSALVCFKTDGGIYPSPFSNGYSHVLSDYSQMGYIFDPSGTICWSYPYYFSDGEMVHAQGGGCLITKKDISGFDSVGYEYTIYNHDGSVLDRLSSENDVYVQYWGQGVFAFNGIGYYCQKTNKWVYDELHISGGLDTPPFDEAQVDALVIDTVDEGTTCGVVVLYPDGETRTMFFDWEKYHEKYGNFSAIVDGVCTLLLPNTCLTLNVETGEIYEIDEGYAKKIYCYDNQNRFIADFTPRDGRVVVPLLGADKSLYIGIFDTRMQLVAGPLSCDYPFPSYSNSKIIFNEPAMNPKILVYDTDGNLIFNLTELGYNNWIPYGNLDGYQYSCNILLAQDLQNFNQVYLDSNGMPIKLDFDNARTVLF